jgi:cytochrome o ubiquinol oxidase subunit II
MLEKPSLDNPPATASRSLRLIPLASSLLLSGCAGAGQSFMTPEGPISISQYYHLWFVTLVTLIVVLPVLIGVPLLAWRYRYGNKQARYAPNWDFSAALEWPMWLVPCAIVVVLSVYLWADSHRLDPYRPLASARPPLEVQVVGLDWKWLFIYPQYHVATVGEMAFPQDRPVSMTLTSDTVMQSFMIPALGGQIYTMPGMVTRLNLKADRTGSFDGMNTQYNGNGFHSQHFEAIAMTSQGFDSWLRSVQENGIALNQTSYRILGRSSTEDQVHAALGNEAMPAGVTFFNSVAPDFFMGIVMRYDDGKPVPPSDQPGSAAYNRQVASK